MSYPYKYQKTRRHALKTILASASVAASFNAFGLSTHGRNQMNITVIVSFETKEDKTSDFSKILENVKIELPKVEGCIGVTIFQSASQSNQFTLVEKWKNKELHQTNLDKLANNGTWDTIASHLSKDPTSDYFIQL